MKQNPMNKMLSVEKKHMHRLALTRRFFDALLTIIIYVIIVIVFVLPLVYILGNSVRDSKGIWDNAYPATWKTFIPNKRITLNNYEMALGIDPIGKTLGMDISHNLWISLASSCCVVSSSLVFNTAAAYFFGRLKFPGKKYLLIYVMATMMIPQQVVIVPLYLVAEKLNIINTFWALIVPWYASPFVVFLLTQFMSDIPREYDEAAIIDGANYWQILLKVIIPNIIPGLMTVSLMEFQFIWNEFYWPMIAVNNKNLYPIQVAIASQFTESAPSWGIVFSGMLLASAPIILLFLFLQRYFFESVAMTGLKG
ncbi:MAG TPA: carbohydrate ABC transporter permease [Anaerolineae bacterium]|nr:carbohydrate ABC transporter permease [Anaerolineae bacterium]